MVGGGELLGPLEASVFIIMYKQMELLFIGVGCLASDPLLGCGYMRVNPPPSPQVWDLPSFPCKPFARVSVSVGGHWMLKLEESLLSSLAITLMANNDDSSDYVCVSDYTIIQDSYGAKEKKIIQ